MSALSCPMRSESPPAWMATVSMLLIIIEVELDT
jgi:hypothetical protein